MNIATSEGRETVAYLYPAGDDRHYGPPEEDQEAWFDTLPDQGREFRKFHNGEWVPDPDGTDGGL